MSSLIALSLINILVVAVVVLIHHEFLTLMSQRLHRHNHKARFKVVFGVCGALVAHSVEVWVFALAYFLLIRSGGFGNFDGNFNGGFIDCIYLSFTCYTTLGFGDIVPVGDIRFLAVLESLTGLVLITWSASFLYLQMQAFWTENGSRNGSEDEADPEQIGSILPAIDFDYSIVLTVDATRFVLPKFC